MRIVHVTACAPYNDYWGYQDNLLPKYHAKLGHEVTMITTNTKQEGGKVVEVPCDDYILSDGVRVIRLKRRNYGNIILNNLRSKLDIYELLCQLKPDFIFFHSLASDSIYDAVKYKKVNNPACIIVQDNHLDYNIGRGSSSFKDKIIREFGRRRVRKTIFSINKVFGVTPWRKQYAEDYYRVPKDKTDVLIMGADDDEVNLAEKELIRRDTRAKYGIADDEMLVVTGGKIDEKKKIHLLMDAVKSLNKVKLIVFGAAQKEFQDEFNSHINSNVITTGWIPAEKTYDYLLSADLVVFPGQHSVLWEQACACKVPCVFAKWEKMDHVNNGGNSTFINHISTESIRREIERLYFTEAYYTMKRIAESDATDIYMYSSIAKKSLEI